MSAGLVRSSQPMLALFFSPPDRPPFMYSPIPTDTEKR